MNHAVRTAKNAMVHLEVRVSFSAPSDALSIEATQVLERRFRVSPSYIEANHVWQLSIVENSAVSFGPIDQYRTVERGAAVS